MDNKSFRDMIRSVLRERIELEDNDDFGIEAHWRQEIDLFKQDMAETIRFFDQNCTPEEFDWFSEIIADLADETQSKPFVDCLFRYLLAHPECITMPGVYNHCLYAEGNIKDLSWECSLRESLNNCCFGDNSISDT
ncbi:MAG: hypothetical protein IJ268_00030 [Proteobacteria bacterium]|nr:hypothetical protein [Pseudomonadota bacterium]